MWIINRDPTTLCLLPPSCGIRDACPDQWRL